MGSSLTVLELPAPDRLQFLLDGPASNRPQRAPVALYQPISIGLGYCFKFVNKYIRIAHLYWLGFGPGHSDGESQWIFYLIAEGSSRSYCLITNNQDERRKEYSQDALGGSVLGKYGVRTWERARTNLV